MTDAATPPTAEREGDEGDQGAEAGDGGAGSSEGKSRTMHDADVANGENPAE